jgi:hypothetical protein
MKKLLSILALSLSFYECVYASPSFGTIPPQNCCKANLKNSSGAVVAVCEIANNGVKCTKPNGSDYSNSFVLCAGKEWTTTNSDYSIVCQNN